MNGIVSQFNPFHIFTIYFPSTHNFQVDFPSDIFQPNAPIVPFVLHTLPTTSFYIQAPSPYGKKNEAPATRNTLKLCGTQILFSNLFSSA
jgi:hypothetical protein